MPPSVRTLSKYGITEAEWQVLYDKYDGTCHICRKPSKRLVVDHEHQKGWKDKSPEERRLSVRGVLCWICNAKILTRGVTIEKLKNAVTYLEEYENNRTN